MAFGVKVYYAVCGVWYFCWSYHILFIWCVVCVTGVVCDTVGYSVVICGVVAFDVGAVVCGV